MKMHFLELGYLMNLVEPLLTKYYEIIILEPIILLELKILMIYHLHMPHCFGNKGLHSGRILLHLHNITIAYMNGISIWYGAMKDGLRVV